MRLFVFIISFFLILSVSVNAAAYAAPNEPESARPYMPEQEDNFLQGIWYIFKTALTKVKPEFVHASGLCFSVIVVVLLTSISETISKSSQNVIQLTATVIIGVLLFSPVNSMIESGRQAIIELSDYSKLLLPIMASALAAQGGISTAAAMYTGTIIFNSILSEIIINFIIPLLYIFLCLSIADCAVKQAFLKRIKKLIKWIMTWALKIVLYVFTGFISITGVISGTVDKSALKAAKLAITGVVPIVGNIISDATETVLISTDIMKNSVGIYGLYVIIAICMGPFIYIATRYLLIKICGAVCNLFGSKEVVCLVDDFATGMGYVMAMAGSVCVMLIISLVCFIRGLGI